MRNAGDRVPGGSSRGRRAADPEPPPPKGGGASLFTPAYRATQSVTGAGPANTGYGRSAADLPGSDHSRALSPSGQPGTGFEHSGHRDDRAGRPGQVWPDDDLRSAYSWTSDDVSLWPDENVLTNAVRGFPPAPGEPLPIYPPGPFAAWNRGQPDQGGGRGGQDTQHRAGSSQLVTATITPDEFDTDYSLPAIKDPIPGQAARAGGADRGRRSPATATHAPAREQRRRQDKQAPAADEHGPAIGTSRQAGRSGRTSRKRQPVWLAITAAGVIIAAVAAVLVLTSPSASPPKQPKSSNTPPSASASPTPPAGKWGYIGARKTDPVPLTIAELYPASFSSGGTKYTRATQAKSKNCRAALTGSALQAGVRHADCTQTLRATYLSK